MLFNLFYIFLFIFSFNVYIFLKQFFLFIFIACTFYWIVNIFVYLINISFFKGMPSSITRFWKRGIMLFWGIELFLCACIFYVLLNCSIETEWVVYQNQLFYNSEFFSVDLIFSILYILTLILVFSINLLFLNKNSSIFSLCVVLSIFFIFFILLDEFYQFFFHTQLFFNYSSLFDNESFLWEYVSTNQPSLVIKQYYFLIVFLKFWHAFFVYISILYSFKIMFNKNKTINLSIFKISSLNLNFLIIFNIIPFIFSIKMWLNTYNMSTYFWLNNFTSLKVLFFDILLFLW